MGVLGKALKDRPAVKRQPCSISVYMQGMDADDIKALNAAFADPKAASTWIAREMTAAGFPTQGSTVRRHRRGDCMCGKRSG